MSKLTALDGHDGRLFASTSWTLVSQAGGATDDAARQRALTLLCVAYWRPLYLFLRGQGCGPDDAQDLTQGFFADLIETRSYERADKEKGRFRSFLLGALKHFVADAADRERALKRGGGYIREELSDHAIAEMDAQFDRGSQDDPAHLYDREWAATLVRRTFARLEQECAIAGKDDLFHDLQPFLGARDETAIPYAEFGQRFHRPVTTLRSDVARLRARYRAILREEVRGTVAADAEVDDELRHLCRVLARA
jgi:DNA-directed RNA polymerase specialized sigma24 family protein